MQNGANGDAYRWHIVPDGWHSRITRHCSILASQRNSHVTLSCFGNTTLCIWTEWSGVHLTTAYTCLVYFRGFSDTAGLQLKAYHHFLILDNILIKTDWLTDHPQGSESPQRLFPPDSLLPITCFKDKKGSQDVLVQGLGVCGSSQRIESLKPSRILPAVCQNHWSPKLQSYGFDEVVHCLVTFRTPRSCSLHAMSGAHDHFQLYKVPTRERG